MPRLLCLMPFGVEVMVDGFFDNDSDNFCQCRLSGISFSQLAVLVGWGVGGWWVLVEIGSVVSTSVGWRDQNSAESERSLSGPFRVSVASLPLGGGVPCRHLRRV